MALLLRVALNDRRIVLRPCLSMQELSFTCLL